MTSVERGAVDGAGDGVGVGSRAVGRRPQCPSSERATAGRRRHVLASVRPNAGPSTARGDGVGVGSRLLTELPAVPVFQACYRWAAASARWRRSGQRGRRRRGDGVTSALELLTELPAVPVFQTLYYAASVDGVGRGPTRGRRRRAAMAWASALAVDRAARSARRRTAHATAGRRRPSMAWRGQQRGRRRRAAMAWASALELLTELPAVPVFQNYTTGGRRLRTSMAW